MKNFTKVFLLLVVVMMGYGCFQEATASKEVVLKKNVKKSDTEETQEVNTPENPTIEFTYPDWEENVTGVLTKGGKIDIVYNANRLPRGRASKYGYPAWSMLFYYKFKESDNFVYVNLTKDSETYPIMTGTIDVPEDAESLEIYINNNDLYGVNDYDNNYGDNYKFSLSNEQKVYFRGTSNDFGLTEMTKGDDNLFRITQNFELGSEDRFKIDLKGDWSECYPSTDFYITEGKGKYDIVFDINSKDISVNKKETQYKLSCDPYEGEILEGDETFELPKVGTASLNGDLFQVSLSWTPELDVNKVGVTIYKAYYNDASCEFALTVKNKEGFTSNFETVYLRGTMNNWETTAMTLVADYTWEVETHGLVNFKFDVYGDWTENYGDNQNDGVCDIMGRNMGINDYGNFILTFNDETLEYSWRVKSEKLLTVSPDRATIILGDDYKLPVMGFLEENGIREEVILGEWTPALDLSKIGTTKYTTNYEGASTQFWLTIETGFVSNFDELSVRGTNNGWHSEKMVLIADNTWSTTVTFNDSENERFKFDLYGDWTENYGDNENDLEADFYGADIYVEANATYDITFNDISLYYTLEKK